MDKKIRHKRLLDCRYFNDEPEVPAGIDSMFWNYECGWVNGKHENFECEREDIKRLGLSEWLYNNDGTNPDFKCLLFNRYCHWIGLHGDTDGFINWYTENYVEPRLTNRQRRANERRPVLMARCRFFKGEELCPFEDEKEEHFWNYEKIWVERLSQSYTYAGNWRDELIPYKEIQAYVKEKGLPSSFIGLLINRDKHWLGMFSEQDFLRYLRKYYVKE